MKLMKEAGCGSVFIGLESVSEKNLSAMSENVNLGHELPGGDREDTITWSAGHRIIYRWI